MFSTQQDQPQCPFLLFLSVRTGSGGSSRFSFDFPELVGVGENEIHVFVEGEEGADEDTAVLKMAAHAVVDVLQHLRALADLRHLGMRECVVRDNFS